MYIYLSFLLHVYSHPPSQCVCVTAVCMCVCHSHMYVCVYLLMLCVCHSRMYVMCVCTSSYCVCVTAICMCVCHGHMYNVRMCVYLLMLWVWNLRLLYCSRLVTHTTSVLGSRQMGGCVANRSWLSRNKRSSWTTSEQYVFSFGLVQNNTLPTCTPIQPYSARMSPENTHKLIGIYMEVLILGVKH